MKRKHRILLIDDSWEILKTLKAFLERKYEILTAGNGFDGLETVEQNENSIDLVVTDLMMPELDGFETLRMIRETSDTPVLMLTVRNTEEDKVRGLDAGADDYITKPFSPRELVSRVRAVLRRVPSLTPPGSAILKIDERLSVDMNTAEVIVEGERINLRPTEFRLLRHLLENAGWTVPHSTLLSKVWGYEYKDAISYLRLYINYLRQKIEVDTSNPQYIITERGLGYRFVDFRREQEGDASNKIEAKEERT